MFKEYSSAEVYEAGKKYLQKERDELIDNCYRARLIPSYSNVTFSTRELKSMYSGFLLSQRR